MYTYRHGRYNAIIPRARGGKLKCVVAYMVFLHIWRDTEHYLKVGYDRTNLKVGYDKHRMFDIKSRAEFDKL